MVDLWHSRSVGLKVWGFDVDPHVLASKFQVLSEANAKGSGHGNVSRFKENQLHLVHQINEGDSWGDSLVSLVSGLGGVQNVLSELTLICPKNFFFVVNLPLSDFQYQQSNDFSLECINILNELGCDVTFNFF
ncbi:hypothetical protein TUMSATVNIG1_13940 [Vibrio nigripulchritudo]|uniref:hypothetical protein n=1 Tax=Vibrio nigripulchritudo TaxID=28173 RepID=UPI00190D49A2|nr:hypothetical protein [Vibrio nigripulchritudo]BCL69445.1 hypothetical protein VNTUMSATTG_13820 [Vibrio nigripulchritudo]BDU30785.1 hypothetical protein TUMSATVNIG1_13940 [Vibrio nigripulchritudo]